MNNTDIGDFKSPSRKPVVILVLAVVVILLGWRWYAKYRASAPADVSSPRLSCSARKPAPPADPEKTAPAPVKAAPPAPSAAPQAVTTADTNVNRMLAQAFDGESRKAWLEARKLYLQILRLNLDDKGRSEVEQRAGALNVLLVMNPQMMPEKTEYVVKAGDKIEKIARKHGTTAELIQKSNGLSNPGLIKAGDRLMVMTGKFAVRISKGRNDLLVSLNNDFFRRYTVTTGKFGKTPVGNFVISDKIKEPVWWRPDGKRIPFGHPENILGTRWMSLKAADPSTPDVKGYGIHGTWDESSLGKAESAGCIRMRNSDVEELYTLFPLGTSVTITE